MGRALTDAQVKQAFGDPLGGKEPIISATGGLAVDAPWAAAKLVDVHFNYGVAAQMGTTWFQRLAAPWLNNFFAELRRAGLGYLVESWDGGYVARLVRGSTQTISRHTYAMAFDINARRLPQGSTKGQDPRLVEIANRNGFYNGQRGGGLWSKPSKWDPMHFEFCALELLEGGAAPAPVIELPGGKRIAGRLIEGSVYAPVRALAEGLGCTVEWEAERQTARINKH